MIDVIKLGKLSKIVPLTSTNADIIGDIPNITIITRFILIGDTKV